MTYSHPKVQVKWSVASKDKLKANGWTDGQTDGGECITSHTNMVGNNSNNKQAKNCSIVSTRQALLTSIIAECLEMK